MKLPNITLHIDHKKAYNIHLSLFVEAFQVRLGGFLHASCRNLFFSSKNHTGTKKRYLLFHRENDKVQISTKTVLVKWSKTEY